MVAAIRPPEALIPRRNGTISFNAASPPVFNPNATITPTYPDTGRNNNQGLEALTASRDGKYLYTMLQSSTIQEGGKNTSTRYNTRLLKYKLKKGGADLEAEYIVQLPVLKTGWIAAQSEIKYISKNQFLVLSRDGAAGHGQKDSESIYRNADIIDISKATNIKNEKYDAVDGAVANTKGELNKDIKPAEYCPWLSYNNNTQLNRFGLHNGGPQDARLLNEKWESLALVPVAKKFRTKGEGKEHYLITFSDNDFITQNGNFSLFPSQMQFSDKATLGYYNGGKNKYSDASGFNLDTQILVFKVRLPKGAKPSF